MTKEGDLICVDDFCKNHFKADVTLLVFCFVLLIYLIYILVKVFKIIKFKNKAIIGMIVLLCIE